MFEKIRKSSKKRKNQNQFFVLMVLFVISWIVFNVHVYENTPLEKVSGNIENISVNYNGNKEAVIFLDDKEEYIILRGSAYNYFSENSYVLLNKDVNLKYKKIFNRNIVTEYEVYMKLNLDIN